MKKSKGRLAALATGLCVVVLVLWSWRDLSIEYHLDWLRRSPQYLRELVAAQPGTLRRCALLKFLETPQGRSRLVTDYLGAVGGWLERRNKQELFHECKMAVLAAVEGEIRWNIWGPRFVGGGGISFTGDTKELFPIHAILPHIVGNIVQVDDYPEHVISIFPMEEILGRRSDLRKAGWSISSREQIGILIENRVVRLDAPSRLIGEWECEAINGTRLMLSAVRFSKDGRFAASKLSESQEESVHRGSYNLDGELVCLRYESGLGEFYKFEFTCSDELLLRANGAVNGFRRPSDAPESWRNKIGIAALKEP